MGVSEDMLTELESELLESESELKRSELSILVWDIIWQASSIVVWVLLTCELTVFILAEEYKQRQLYIGGYQRKQRERLNVVEDEKKRVETSMGASRFQ